jgi:hypothetical protein
VKSEVPAAAWAEQQVTAVSDDLAGRLALMQRCYYGPFGKAPRHLPYRRAALSFMHWQLRRGVLQPSFSDRPGSPWWRAVNGRILRDGCEAVALSGGLRGPASSRTVDYRMSFVDYPTARAEDVPAFVELESGGPPPVACRVVGVGQPPSRPTKEGDRREQHLPDEGPPCPA